MLRWGAAPAWPLCGVHDADLRLPLGCPRSRHKQSLRETAAACCCGSEPCTGHRALSFTHSFPLGEGTNLLPKKLSPALRDLAEAQEIALLYFSLRWAVLTASEGGYVFWRERKAT